MHRTLLASILVSATTVASADTPRRTAPADGDSLGTVDFKRGSMRLTDAERDEVEDIARWHADHPDSILIIEGHTAREGSRRKNLRVSQDRTDRVRDALLAAGADRSRMVLVAHPTSLPGTPRGATGRVVIRSSTGFTDLAREQRDPGVGEDARAARRTIDPRRSAPDAVRGRDRGAGAGGSTVVIVPGGGSGGASTTIVQGAAGGAGRTSGGTGASAQTGLGLDPTDGEDRAPTNPAGAPNAGAAPGAVAGGAGGVVVGGDTPAAGGTTAGAATRGGGVGAAGAPGGATGGSTTGSPVGAGVTGTGPGAATAPTRGGATGAGTATGAGASGAGTAGTLGGQNAGAAPGGAAGAGGTGGGGATGGGGR